MRIAYLDRASFGRALEEPRSNSLDFILDKENR